MLSIPVFVIAYMLKGGQFPVRFGKALSAGLVFSFVVNDTDNILTALFMTAAWLLAVAPSMGEEAGAIGRVGHWWENIVSAASIECTVLGKCD